jgi:TonB family protein
MRLSLLVASLSVLTLTAQDSTTSRYWRNWFESGVEAYKNSNYREAVEDFQKSVDLNPNEVEPQLYLALAWMSQHIPGDVSPENLGLRHKAETEFNRVLQLDPSNLIAMQSLASLSFIEARGMIDMDEKIRKLDQAASWYRRVLAVDPRDSKAYYSLAVIDWANWYPNLMRARADLRMRPEEPGPLIDPAVRQSLLQRYSAVISDGIANLNKALGINPKYDDAMAYMNLFIRECADLRDTPEEYKRDIEEADQWVQKAVDSKKMRAATVSSSTEPPPPLPPPGDQQAPQRIQVGSILTPNNLIRHVRPVYPQEAKAAHIEGTVRFAATIGKTGRILNLQVISGHPLLVESALVAVRQWEYKPILLNGQPVEIKTMIDVNFTLSQ